MANTKAKKTEVVKEEKIDVETIKKELKQVDEELNAKICGLFN